MRERPDDLERVLGRGLSRVNLVGRLAEKEVPQCSEHECGCKRPTGQPNCHMRAAYYCIRGRGWSRQVCSRVSMPKAWPSAIKITRARGREAQRGLGPVG